MAEEWREVYGFDTLYEISNMGRIRTKNHGKAGYLPEYRYVKPIDNGNGYLRLNLKNNGTQRTVYIHRLVAIYFIENPNRYKEVNHKDGNKHNNCVDNLEWCDREYNANYGTRNARLSKRRRKKVLCVETGIIYGSLEEAGRDVNVCKSAINNCIKGRSQSCAGFTWRRVDV